MVVTRAKSRTGKATAFEFACRGPPFNSGLQALILKLKSFLIMRKKIMQQTNKSRVDKKFEMYYMNILRVIFTSFIKL